MAKPEFRNSEIRKFTNKLCGVDVEESIRIDRCIAPPIGCGKAAESFKDEISRKEFAISGMCQECQDKYWEFDPEGEL